MLNEDINKRWISGKSIGRNHCLDYCDVLLEKLILSVQIKPPETPILSSTSNFESNTILSNGYIVIVRG